LKKIKFIKNGIFKKLIFEKNQKNEIFYFFINFKNLKFRKNKKNFLNFFCPKKKFFGPGEGEER